MLLNKDRESTNLSSTRREEAHFLYISFPPVIDWPWQEEVSSFFKGSNNFNLTNTFLCFCDFIVKAGAHKPQWKAGIWMCCVVSNRACKWGLVSNLLSELDNCRMASEVGGEMGTVGLCHVSQILVEIIEPLQERYGETVLLGLLPQHQHCWTNLPHTGQQKLTNVPNNCRLYFKY